MSELILVTTEAKEAFPECFVAHLFWPDGRLLCQYVVASEETEDLFETTKRLVKKLAPGSTYVWKGRLPKELLR